MNKEFKDYYKILGVSKSATDVEIKKAYRQIAKNCHPDKVNQLEISEEEKALRIEKFKKASEAMDELRTPEKRKAYDATYEKYYREKAEEQRNKQQNQQSQQSQQSRYYSHNTRYQENAGREKSRYKTSGKETFKKSLRKAYKEVKQDEARNPFLKRHRNINRKIHQKFNWRNITIPKVIAFRCSQGVIHVALESWYQIQKLGSITDDSVVKYVLRNRKIIAALTAAIIMGSVFDGNSADESIVVDGESITAEQTSDSNTTTDDETVAYTTTTVLSRNYVVRSGDTLSELAHDSGTSINTIKEINDLPSDIIQWGSTLKIPYEIYNEDLQYYTLSVPTEGTSIYDLAEEFETDVDTIYCLNKESIQTVEGVYVILSDKVLVPNFITKDDLKAKKENQYTKTNQ